MAYHCPVEVTTEVIGGRWTPVILAHLKQGLLRYAQLRRLMPDISEKMLTQRLHELAERGVVERTLINAKPPHVEYALTELGTTLAPVLQAMWDWGQASAAERGLIISPPA